VTETGKRKNTLEKKSIVISVFGRQFPARVDAEEAAVIQRAAQSINAKIKAFKAEYKTQDDLDIAIMCCLDIMTEHMTHEAQSRKQAQAVSQQLSHLEETLDKTLDLTQEA